MFDIQTRAIPSKVIVWEACVVLEIFCIFFFMLSAKTPLELNKRIYIYVSFS